MIGRTNAGGGGGLQDTDALLRVQAPAGSVVTITKGATTKTDHGHENALDPSVYDYYFIIHQSQFDSVNSWTVTATLGSNTATSTVVVDAADEYDVILQYKIYLVTDGVLSADYPLSNQLRTPHPVTLTPNTGYIQVTMDGIYLGGIATNSKIDITLFSTLKAEMTTQSVATSWAGLWPNYGYTTDTEVSNNAIARVEHRYASKTIVSLDITSYTGEAYVGVEITSSSSNGFVNVWNLWLE